jgi:hypothetical protein
MLSNKYFWALLILFTVLMGCDQASKSSDNTMQLSGSIDGLRKGTVYLQKMQDSTLVSIDSVVVNGSPKFAFKTEVESPEIYYLYLNKEDGDSLNDRILFFGEPGQITISKRRQQWRCGGFDSKSDGQSHKEALSLCAELCQHPRGQCDRPFYRPYGSLRCKCEVFGHGGIQAE